MLSELPSPTAQQLWNFLVPLASLLGCAVVGFKFWMSIKKQFASKEEFDSFKNMTDESIKSIRLDMNGAAEERYQKLKRGLEQIREELRRKGH